MNARLVTRLDRPGAAGMQRSNAGRGIPTRANQHSQVEDEAGGTFGNIQGSSTPSASTGTPREKMEQLLNIALVSPFFLTLVIFTVAIVFAPAVKNEIAPATAHDHEEIDHAYSSSPEMVAVLASGLGSERGDRMDEDQKMDEGSIQVRDLTKSEGVVDEPDSSDPTLRNRSRSFANREARIRGVID